MARFVYFFWWSKAVPLCMRTVIPSVIARPHVVGQFVHNVYCGQDTGRIWVEVIFSESVMDISIGQSEINSLASWIRLF